MSSDERDDQQQPDRPIGRSRRRASRPAGAPVGDSPAVESRPIESYEVESTGVELPTAEASPAEATAVETAVSETDRSEPDTSGAAVSEKKAKRSLAAVLGTAVGALAVLGLIVAVVLLSIAKHNANTRDEKRAEFVQAARQSVLNLTTIHPNTAKQDVDRILAGASGEFKQEFAGKEDPFISIVTDAKVATDGKIIDAGLESENGDSANVLVAATSMVSNTGNTDPTPRNFRLRVTITDDGDRMTTSKVEFVA